MKYICRIGNNAQNDLVIHDRAAADFHAQISMDADDRVWVKDLDTKYGTRVNGIRISKHELTYSDELRIGFHVIDWISVRNNWLTAQTMNVDSKFWSEPLKQESSFSTVSAEISHKLAEEANLNREEFNVKELDNTNSQEDEPVQITPAEIPHEKDIQIERSATEESPDANVRPEKSNIESFNDIDNLHELKDIANDSSTFTVVTNPIVDESPSSSIDPTNLIQNETQVDHQIEAEIMVDAATENAEATSTNVTTEELESPKMESPALVVQTPTVDTNQNIDSTKVEETIMFDYTSKHSGQTQRKPEGEVRVVAKTSVPNLEQIPSKSALTKDYKLIVLVCVIITAMLGIGWLLAYFSNN